MKLILLADIERLGHLGDEVTVAKGYGRNFLLPKGLALLASPENMKVFEQQRRKFQVKMDALRSEAHVQKDAIQDKMISISVRSGENNKLYGSVTTHMIADALAVEGIIVDRRRILLDAPIRSLGDYSIRVRLHADIIADFALSVVSDRSEVIYDDLDEALIEKAAENLEFVDEIEENSETEE